MVGNLDVLSRRAGFNTALRHFKATSALLKPVEQGQNLADLVAVALERGTITRPQVRPIVSALLPDKYGYRVISRNVAEPIDSVEQIIETLKPWTALQIIIAYEHPEEGLYLINPRSKESWEPVLPIRKDELIVVYLDAMPWATISGDSLDKAVVDVHAVLAGSKPRGRKEYVVPESAIPALQPRRTAALTRSAAPDGVQQEGGRRRITPRYSAVVTNELFHNGNVEAWKRIIASYTQTHPELDVLIWYDNERINDINALFKWGKVKHGTPIMFSVVGTKIKDVSKLQRYLFEGASPRFEIYLKGGINQPLELF